MDEYDHLTDAQWLLHDLMGQISEDCFCAGWIGNCEYDIWQALQHEDPWAPNHPMSPRHLRLCLKLSTEIDGWIYWADGPQFAPMAQWLAMVNTRPSFLPSQENEIEASSSIVNTPIPPLDLSPLQNALTSLRRAVTRWQATAEQDEELRDACIQRFEYTFELSWKMLARRLERDLPDAQSVDAMSFRELMRSGGERGLVRDVDAWMAFRDKRNTTSHTYNAAKAADVAAVIPNFADHAGELLAKLLARSAADD